jgi:uncharacterized membrane protein YhaH (DUF805 family)
MTMAKTMDNQPRERSPLFSLRGRLGRTRYIVYSLGAVVMVFVFMIFARFGLMPFGRIGALVYYSFGMLLYYALLPVLFAMLTVRRAHDFNVGGWLALLILVPFVNLLFWFVPGSRGENRFGPVPPFESFGMRLAAGALPVLLITTFATAQPDGMHTQAPGSPRSSTILKSYTP